MIEVDGYWYPFMNEVAANNMGHGGEMKNILAHVTNWSVAIDGGPQVGRVANALAKKFERVYAIELSRLNYDCLRKNAAANVVPIWGCLTNTIGGYFMAAPDKHPASPVFRAIPCWPGTNWAPGVTIDELGLESCGFVKLDLQGYDYFALLGAEHTLRRFRPPVYFEYDPSCFERYGIHKDASTIYLESLGYRYLGTDDGNQLWIC